MEHRINAYWLISEHAGKSISVMDVQLANALYPTNVHSGIKTLDNAEQLKNAMLEIDLHTGKLIVVRLVQRTKAL